MLIPLGILASAGAGGGVAEPAYELIATAFGTGSSATISFTSIPQDYKHLQLRFVSKSTGSSGRDVRIQFNNDSSGYVYHYLEGDGSSVQSNDALSQSYIALLDASHNSSGNESFGAGVVDILDYTSSTKTKTVRSLHGNAGTNDTISLTSGLWNDSPAAINRITVLLSQNFDEGSRFSLYGIKG